MKIVILGIDLGKTVCSMAGLDETGQVVLRKRVRQRVVAVVENGMTRRGAADRFGPQPQGGDKRSHRIEAHAGEILALVEERPDITLAEIVAHLEQAQGLRVAQSTVWRFFRRHDITFKKTAHASETLSLLRWPHPRLLAFWKGITDAPKKESEIARFRHPKPGKPAISTTSSGRKTIPLQELARCSRGT